MAEHTPFPWRQVLTRRIAVAAIGFLLWSLGIESRLVYLQVYDHANLRARAEDQQNFVVEAPAKRGEILDRSGHVLAYSVDVDSVYAVPLEIESAQTAAAALCGALEDCTQAEQESLAGKFRVQKAFAYVRRQVTPDQARRVSALRLGGVGFMKEGRRFYPNKELASHLLGYVGLDSNGLEGIEATYDKLIKGRAGTLLVQTDAKRHAFSRLERPPTTGATLELTIDEYLQHVAERELRAGVQWAGAAGGAAVVMDPASGEILALANYPTFNPNAFGMFQADQRRNRAIQDLYEPGSTFKIVTASAALDDKLFTPDTPVETSPGRIRFGSRVIDEDKGHNYGLLSFTDVIVKSSNVGAIKIGLSVGHDRMSDYVRRFGFGHTSSPDFHGESAGMVTSAARLTESALASVSMGYQIGVTPLQMATAVSVVANGGELLRPRVVRAVIRDRRRIAVPRRVLGRAINRDTAAALTAIMEQVVERGTGKQAQVPGYTISGKTGTAQKVVNRRYSNTDYNVSFVGFVPSRKPAYAIVVVVDSPHGVPPYGGTVAAPIFRRIAEAALRYGGVPPTIDPLPPLFVARRNEPSETLTSGPAALPAIVPVSGSSATTEGASLFPDLRGLSARDALRTVVQLGMTARLHGAGRVVLQRPEPGSLLERGAASTLWLQRTSAMPVVLAVNGPQP